MTRLAAPFFVTVVAWGTLAFAAPAKDLRVETPVARETLPGQTVGSAYLVIHNDSTVPVRLQSASSPVARDVQIHDMSLHDGVMRMRQVVDGVTIPARGKLVFESGGMHLMLVGLHAPLTAGDRIPLTLRFERRGELTVSLRVTSIDGTFPAPKTAAPKP